MGSISENQSVQFLLLHLDKMSLFLRHENLFVASKLWTFKLVLI